jgi:photosystem II stability/assembly factor-like uncharacterized protein
MDELERAGRAVRESIAAEREPNDRVRARARTIVRRRRTVAAGSIATAVVVASIGVAVAVNGRDGLGVHTIGPAGSTTTNASVTTFVRNGVEVPGLPKIAFADALRGWRVEPTNGRTLEHTSDGGRTWTTVHIEVPGEDTSLTGVVAIDNRHAFSIVVNGIGNSVPRLIRTTDGVRWERALGAGVDDRSNAFFVSFVDANHGWGLTQYGGALSTADGGDHWRAMTQPAAVQFATLCLAARGTGWAATGRSVYRSDDDGATWHRELTIPVGGGSGIDLVCKGDHAAYASYSVGAGQHSGGFVRTDDGGAHWRALVEDTASAGPVNAPGFPDSQLRGVPTAMAADGTLVFQGGCYVCGPAQNWVVTASPADGFVVGRFDDSDTQRFEVIDATAVDRSYAFAEVRRLDPNSPTGGTVFFYATSDGGHTWVRSSG